MNHFISSIENRSIPETGTPVGGSVSASSLSSSLGSDMMSSAEDSTTVEEGAEIVVSPVAESGGKAGHTGVRGFT